ncbi:putative 21.7 KDA protein IN SYRB 5'REGION (ORF4) (plasmid) [Sinorhizobium sp. CCBAU 05631]|nr:putative 21.7 KDA protein IN SYRB 5'REGION (ORF4) [Sinorhizobium sp. CCBAU 05631]
MKGDGDVAQALRPPIDAEEVQTTARHEADHSGAEANSLVTKSAAAKSPSKPRIKRRERGERANAQVAAQSAVPPKPHQSVQPSSSRDLFFHEVATLDEEIEMLRTQLAQKLHLQNVQLKKMLERFEVS